MHLTSSFLKNQQSFPIVLLQFGEIFSTKCGKIFVLIWARFCTFLLFGPRRPLLRLCTSALLINICFVLVGDVTAQGHGGKFKKIAAKRGNEKVCDVPHKYVIG